MPTEDMAFDVSLAAPLCLSKACEIDTGRKISAEWDGAGFDAAKLVNKHRRGKNEIGYGDY